MHCAEASVERVTHRCPYRSLIRDDTYRAGPSSLAECLELALWRSWPLDPHAGP